MSIGGLSRLQTPRPPGPSHWEQLCGQLVVTSSVTETATASAKIAPASPAGGATAAANMRDGGDSADPENRRREKSTVQSVQRGDLLVVGLGGVLCSVVLML